MDGADEQIVGNFLAVFARCRCLFGQRLSCGEYNVRSWNARKTLLLLQLMLMQLNIGFVFHMTRSTCRGNSRWKH